MSNNKKKGLDSMFAMLSKAPEKKDEGKQPFTESGNQTESVGKTDQVYKTDHDGKTVPDGKSKPVGTTSHVRKTVPGGKSKSVKKTRMVREIDKDKPAHHNFKLMQLKELMPSGKVDRQILRRFKAFVDGNLETDFISQSQVLGENAYYSYYKERIARLIHDRKLLKVIEERRVGERSKLGRRFKVLLPIWPNEELDVTKLSDEDLDKEFYLTTLAVQDGEEQYLDYLLRIKMEKERRG